MKPTDILSMDRQCVDDMLKQNQRYTQALRLIECGPDAEMAQIAREALGDTLETVCDAPESQTMPHEHVGSPTVDRGETCLRCGQDMHAPIHTAKIKGDDRGS